MVSRESSRGIIGNDVGLSAAEVSGAAIKRDKKIIKKFRAFFNGEE